MIGSEVNLLLLECLLVLYDYYTRYEHESYT